MISKEKCYIKNCNNSIFLFEIDKQKCINFIASYLDPLLERKQLENLLKFKSWPEFRNSNYCEKCLNLRYGYFITKFKELDKDFCWEKFSDLYVEMAQDLYINELYSSIFEGKDNFKRSILKKIISELSISEEELNEKKHNPEFFWFLVREKYNSVPIYWQKNFILKKYIGEGKNQGKLNGPDFILEDKKTKKTYGFEIFGFNNNIVTVNKPVKDFKKFIESAFPEKIKRGKSATLSDYIAEIIEKINSKLKKWEKFQKTDYKLIGIVLLNSVPDEWYPILNMFFNTYYRNQEESIKGIIFF